MKDSKLICLLNYFSENEIRKFEEFIQSPYFNKNDSVRKFGRELLSFYPEFDESKMILPDDKSSDESSKRFFFDKLFHKEKFDRQKINDLMTYLLRLAEKFLSIQYLEKNIFQAHFNLLKELNIRGDTKSYLSSMRDLSILHDTDINRNAEYYFQDYLIQNESDFREVKMDPRAAREALQKKMDAHDIYFLISKLKDFCEVMNRQTIGSHEFKLPLYQLLIPYISQNLSLLADFPAVMIYYTILQTFIHLESESHYNELKQLLEKNTKFFSPAEAKEMYDYAQNYCVRKINKGEEKFYNELLWLYKTLIKNKLLFEYGRLSEYDYKNIVTVGIRTNDLRWTEQFIEEHKKDLLPEVSANAYIYNLSTLYVAKKDYKNALKLLQKVEFANMVYYLGAKSMLLRMYYELEEPESFYSLCDSFKMYLFRNKKLSGTQRLSNYNLVKFARRLFSIRERFSSKEINLFKKAINSLKQKIETSDVANAQWLLEKISTINVTNKQ